MPNWKIEFEVTHRYFADAQQAIYALRGVNNLAARPIADGPASASRSNGGNKGKTKAIEQLLNSKPKLIFNVEAVARYTNDSPKLAGQKLAYLATNKRIRRVGPGKFASLNRAK